MEGNCFDRKAFAADMLELYADAVFRLAVTRLRNRADAEDTVQEVFLRLYRSGVCFQDTEHVKAWLLRVTVNYCRSLGRSPWKRKVLPAENVSAAVSDRQDRCVVTAVLALPVRYRDVIYLFYYEGYSTAEIARLLRIKEPTVRTRLARGRALLKTQLEGDLCDEV